VTVERVRCHLAPAIGQDRGMRMFRVWAPYADKVELDIAHHAGPGDSAGDRWLMEPSGTPGWWAAQAPQAEPGDDYTFRLDGGEPLADPRAAWLPAGVHGPARLYEQSAYAWHDAGWHGLPLTGAVIYECHVGTFTREGTLDAAIRRLDHLVDLGTDAVELMPVNAFAGPAGWGYDGVGLYAVHEPYGGPEALKRFVDAAHGAGLAVILDVVYNHLGPSGNHLDEFGPYFTDTHRTPWGPAVNLDAPGSDEVRAFLIDNALSWVEHYHADGLRLDAAHAFVDLRATHLLEELAAAVHRLGERLGRSVAVIAESESNDPRLVRPTASGGYGLDAQWSDDFHHALWTALSGERQGYYVDFGSLPTLEAALTRTFVHDGGFSTFRGRSHGRGFGRAQIGGHRFLGYLANHDQIGNRATGDRPFASLSAGLLKVGAALVLCSPYTPMIFMGEEWGASTPWQFFTSFTDPQLAEAVRRGRCEEFAEHGWSAEVPDPQDAATFARSKLDWSEADREPHAGLLAWYRKLIALRRSCPELADDRLDQVYCTYPPAEPPAPHPSATAQPGAKGAGPAGDWFVLHRGRIAVACNLCSQRRGIPVPGTPVDVLAASVHGFVYGEGSIETDGESVVIAVMQ
jgi:maltooligosyltrehalose trehalohydrolase